MRQTYDSIFKVKLFGLLRFECLILWLFTLLSSLGLHSLSAQVSAGTLITNQASAQFNWLGFSYTVNSNLVVNQVNPIYDILITPNGTVESPGLTGYGLPGTRIVYSYILENTGNTSDSYRLSFPFIHEPSDFEPFDRSLYLDIDGDGILDPGEANTTIQSIDNLAAGDFVYILTVISIPSTAKEGQSCYFDLQGTSIGDPTKTDNLNVNRTIVPLDAVLQLKKSASQVELIPGDQLQYQLDLLNVGVQNARAVNLLVDGYARSGIFVYDTIPQNKKQNLQYISGTLSAQPQKGIRLFSTDDRISWKSAMTPSEEPAPQLITDIGFLFTDEIQPGQQAAIQFSVLVPENTNPGNFDNEAHLFYKNQAGLELEDQATNTVRVEVNTSVMGVFIGPHNEPRATGISGPNDDLQTDQGVAPESNENFQIAGNFVQFINTVENAATGVDTLNITLDPRAPAFAESLSTGSFQDHAAQSINYTTIPEDWVIQFYNIDGSTVLRDTNGDGLPDLGPMDPGEMKNLIVSIFIPSDTETTTNDDNGFQAVVRTSSSIDPSVYNLTIDRLPEVQSLYGFWDRFTKEAFSDEIVEPGSTINYKNTFAHNGNFIVLNAVIIDELSPYLTNPRNFSEGIIKNLDGDDFITATATYDAINHAIIWEIPRIPPGFRGSISFDADIAEETPSGSEILNTFSIQSKQTPTARLSNTTKTAISSNSVINFNKTVNREEASIGEPVLYTITVKNEGPTSEVSQLLLTDNLARGFRYLKGTATLNGQPIEPHIDQTGKILSWNLDPLLVGEEHSISYATLVTSEASKGDGINRAILDATFPGGSPTRLRANAEVKLVEGIFAPYSTIVGRVYSDLNDNRAYDAGEPGIESVRVYLDDGSYSITDRDGLYNLPAVTGKMRTVRLDQTTLPPNYVLAEIDTANAGNPSSQFVELRWGVLQRANFRLLPVDKTLKLSDSDSPENAKAELSELILKDTEIILGQQTAKIQLNWENDAIPESMVEPRSGIILIALPGLIDESSVRDQFFANPTLQSIRTYRDQENNQTRIQIRLRKRTSGYSDEFITLENSPNSLIVHLGDPSELDNDPSREVINASIKRPNKEEIDENDPQILSPYEGTAYLSRDKITVKVAAHLTSKAVLYANGQVVSESQIGSRSMDIKKRQSIFEYVGVPINPGINLIKWEVTRNQKTIVKEIRVIAADKPESVDTLVSPQPLFADGVTQPLVAITLRDKNGIPTGEASVVTIESEKGGIVSPDFRPTEIGHQVQIRDGRALFRVAAAQQPETRRFRVILDQVSQEFEVTFKPYTRDWIIVGSVESSTQLGNSLNSQREDSISPEHEDNVNHNGSVSVFAKGTLPWADVVTTVSYDSERDYQKTRLFREFNVDEFYPTYGDESEQGYEAASRDQYYARLEKGESSLLYGDFNTDMRESELVGNSRRFNGTKADIKTKHVDFKGYAAFTDQALIRVEIPGKGISGYYQLDDRNILYNSEEITIETRDPDRPNEVISTETLSRFTDYNFDARIGRILFKRPIPAYDSNFNPVVVVVRYELEDFAQDQYWSYGGRGEIHSADRRFALGVSQLTDENSEADNVVRGVDATVKITPEITAHAEYAESDTLTDGKGDAILLKLESTRETSNYEIFYNSVDETFNNPGMRGSFGGRTELGFNLAHQLNETYALEGEAIHREESSSEEIEYGGFVDLVRRSGSVELRLGTGYAGNEDQADPDASASGAVARIGAGLPIGKKWRIDALHQETFTDVAGQQPTRSELALSYQVSDKSSLVANLQRRKSQSGGFDSNADFGIETAHSENLTYFNRYQLNDGSRGLAGRTNHGFEWTDHWNEQIRYNYGAEITHLAHGNAEASSNQDFWAVTMGLEFTPIDETRVISFRQEYRNDQDRRQYFNELGGTAKINPENTLFARNRLTFAHNIEEESSYNDWIVDFLTGWAYRPVSDDHLNWITDFEVRYEDSGSGAASTRLHDFTLSSEANWQPWTDWTFATKYAARYTIADFTEAGYFTDLKSAWVRHDINKRFYAMAGARWLQQYETSTHDYSYGLEVGATVVKNLQIGVGYNFDGFKDDKFARGDYWERGFYIRLRLKFDESVLGWLNWMERHQKVKE